MRPRAREPRQSPFLFFPAQRRQPAFSPARAAGDINPEKASENMNQAENEKAGARCTARRPETSDPVEGILPRNSQPRPEPRRKPAAAPAAEALVRRLAALIAARKRCILLEGGAP